MKSVKKILILKKDIEIDDTSKSNWTVLALRKGERYDIIGYYGDNPIIAHERLGEVFLEKGEYEIAELLSSGGFGPQK